MGDGSVQVVEGVDTGSGGLVYALNGANGAPLPGPPQATSAPHHRGCRDRRPHRGRLQRRTGPDHQRPGHLRRPECAGGRHPGAGTVALQNSPLVTVDPNGSIGITIAGYNSALMPAPPAHRVGQLDGPLVGPKRSWPMFHQNPQLTGWVGPGGPRPSEPTHRGHGFATPDGGRLLERGHRRRHLLLR